MPCTQLSPCNFRKHINRDNEKQALFDDELIICFCLNHISRTIYHSRTDWLQYRINLVTRVLVDLQQKKNLALNDQLDPQVVLVFIDLTQYAKFCLLYVVFIYL